MAHGDPRTNRAIAEARFALLKAQLRAAPLLLAKAVVMIAILLTVTAAA